MFVCACILILSYLYTRILEGSQPSIVQTDGDERLDFSWQAFDRHSNMVLENAWCSARVCGVPQENAKVSSSSPSCYCMPLVRVGNT